VADDLRDPITAALDGLSIADAELCRRDILLYGSAFVRKLPDGTKVRVPAEDAVGDLTEVTTNCAALTAKMWWE